MSRLAQAGDSSTQSPDWAWAASQRTAPAMSPTMPVGTPQPASAMPMAAASRPISATARPCFFQRRLERREILALAVAAENDGDLAAHAFDGGQRGADIGALGVIDIEHAGDLGDRFDAVRQAGKRLQRRDQACRRDADGFAQGQRRHRVGGIVQTGQFQASTATSGLLPRQMAPSTKP
jgi:hypothetical protein